MTDETRIRLQDPVEFFLTYCIRTATPDESRDLPAPTRVNAHLLYEYFCQVIKANHLRRITPTQFIRLMKGHAETFGIREVYENGKRVYAPVTLHETIPLILNIRESIDIEIDGIAEGEQPINKAVIDDRRDSFMHELSTGNAALQRRNYNRMAAAFVIGLIVGATIVGAAIGFWLPA